LGKNYLQWAAFKGVATGESARVVLGYALLKAIGMACVITVISAAQNVNPETHGVVIPFGS
jgi:hypothetical protein